MYQAISKCVCVTLPSVQCTNDKRSDGRRAPSKIPTLRSRPTESPIVPRLFPPLQSRGHHHPRLLDLNLKSSVSGFQILSRAVGAVFSFSAAPRTIDSCFVCTEDRPEELLSLMIYCQVFAPPSPSSYPSQTLGLHRPLGALPVTSNTIKSGNLM